MRSTPPPVPVLLPILFLLPLSQCATSAHVPTTTPQRIGRSSSINRRNATSGSYGSDTPSSRPFLRRLKDTPSSRPLRIAAVATASFSFSSSPSPTNSTPSLPVPDASVNAGRAMPRYSPYNQLKYFGGGLIVTNTPVHFIYYGSWASGTAARLDKKQLLLRKFMASLGALSPSGPGSVAAWWRINSLYAQKDGQLVTKKVFLASEHYDWYSQGSTIVDDSGGIFNVVKRLLDQRILAASSAAIYVVLTTPDVRVGPAGQGFCGSYCGWHDARAYLTPGAKKKLEIYYGFIGDPTTQCLARGCGMAWGSGPSPNGLPGVDSMISTIGHELAEISTDPDTKTGWLTATTVDGYENADLCQFTVMGSKTGVQKGVKFTYNVVGVQQSRFFVQSNYNPVKASCAMYP